MAPLNPKVSVIVPVYNVEPYLPRCIDSILAQTYTDFELILVDDGSPDNSGAICDEYAAKDPRIRVIHKENGGVSSARNAGLDVATGEYVAFVDSDDYVSMLYLEKLIRNKCDLSICSCYKISENGHSEIFLSVENETYLVTSEKIADWFDKRYLIYVWGKAFRRAIIESANLRFDCRISLGEDTVFAVNYILLCNSIEFIADSLYFYIKYSSGTLTKQLTHQMVISNDLRDRVLDEIFTSRGIKSKLFYSNNYASKLKMKLAFFTIFEDEQMSIIAKYKWYTLFFRLPLFVNNINTLTQDCSTLLRSIIKSKSAILLILFQVMAKNKNRLIHKI